MPSTGEQTVAIFQLVKGGVAWINWFSDTIRMWWHQKSYYATQVRSDTTQQASFQRVCSQNYVVTISAAQREYVDGKNRITYQLSIVLYPFNIIAF